ncbi:MAG: choice-of-anchor tandem repeat GloVer-containing protein [Bacteroidia bacterium]
MKKISTLLISMIIMFNLSNACYAQYIKLYDFDSINGRFPQGSLISDSTFLYGMTTAGGINDSGTVFKIKPDGTGYSKLLDFTFASGGQPFGSLISDGTFLYGMTQDGGAGPCFGGCGTLFKIKPDGTGYSKLLNFTDTTGAEPQGSLFSDGIFLYGMTRSGGINHKGVLFKIKHDGTGYSKLIDFSGAVNGSAACGSLFSDGTFLYGMTQFGGANNYGTIFKIMPNGTGYSKLYDFDSINGSLPTGSLIFDGTFLYGTTYQGGTNNTGALFKIKPDGTAYSKLFDFDPQSGLSGSYPHGDLIFDGTFLYGMTFLGGGNHFGVVFRIKPDGTAYSKMLDFDYSTCGSQPGGSLISDGTYLYGMTSAGGANGEGTIFKLGITTGIVENYLENDFNVSPNPFTEQTTISFNEEQKNCTIKIIDVLGKEIKMISFTGKQLIIEKGEMLKGFYLVQVIDANKNVANKKIVLQ